MQDANTIDTAYEAAEQILSADRIIDLVRNLLIVSAVAWVLSKVSPMNGEVSFLTAFAIYLCWIPLRLVSYFHDQKRMNAEETEEALENATERNQALEQALRQIKASSDKNKQALTQALASLKQAQEDADQAHENFDKARLTAINLSTELTGLKQALEEAGGNEEEARKQREQAARTGYKQGVKDAQRLSKLKKSVPQLKDEQEREQGHKAIEELKRKLHLV